MPANHHEHERGGQSFVVGAIAGLAYMTDEGFDSDS